MKFKLVNKVDEAKGTKSFYFDPNIPIFWEAGQYAYLTIGGITKQFTICSSPTEEQIRITTRVRQESEFKRSLDLLNIGDEIEARAPFGVFVFDKNTKNNVFFAGGIGITPFRSIIKYNVDNNLKVPMYLIYSNSDDDFVFKDELNKLEEENSFIRVCYHDTSKLGRLDNKKISEIIKNEDLKNTTFWAVGPTPFVNAMEDILEEIKIPQDQIRTEKFTGY